MCAVSHLRLVRKRELRLMQVGQGRGDMVEDGHVGELDLTRKEKVTKDVMHTRADGAHGGGSSAEAGRMGKLAV